ncbi:MAG: glycosyltransferase family 2 protein [Alphaproteobacteria bacterium]|nr:glycosyltransferase family 2 protein [Alphaproteobacteria bacterium]
MPAISIIIPMYGVEKYLRRCLDSVANQTFTDWQAICVNDGSPDKSGDIAREYAARDKRFVVIDKENGGLSDARNAGMPYAKGDFILYLDSDDFIHPQTLEIAHFLAMRDGSDIVSFTYDRIYRPQLMVRYKLGLDTDNVIPTRLNKKYDLKKIPTRVTDDVYAYATERTHNKFNPKRKWLIKHCQVWKNLYKRKLIEDIPFIKGILFEDFPWWSRVMLRNPRVTIAPLPLYFYIPNFGGIVLSAKQLRIMQSLCAGIADAYTVYDKKATDYQMQQWNKNFKWYFIKWAFRKLKYMETDADVAAARDCFVSLSKIGALSNPPYKWAEKLREDILDFIGEK